MHYKDTESAEIKKEVGNFKLIKVTNTSLKIKTGYRIEEKTQSGSTNIVMADKKQIYKCFKCKTKGLSC